MVFLQFPFLTSFFNDLARVFLVFVIVLGQSIFWITRCYPNLVKVRIRRVHQYI